MSKLRITEIFYSLQGESRFVGLPTVFIRLTGCPLRCTYCDTEYAFSGGSMMSFADIIQELKKYKTPYICVTGGEPLAQRACFEFLTEISDQGYSISLETSGAIAIQNVDKRVNVVMDLKGPSSGELDKNLWENIEFLKAEDQVKFVIANDEDYQWAKSKIKAYDLSEKVSDVLISPCEGKIDVKDLAEWMLADQLNARLQVQLHKVIWKDARGK